MSRPIHPKSEESEFATWSEETPNSGAEKRTAPRLSAPMTVVIGNTPYAIENWSVCGMKISEYSGSLTPQDKTDFRVLVPSAGPGSVFWAAGDVRRQDAETSSLAIEFDGLDIVAIGTLNRYFQERMAHDA